MSFFEFPSRFGDYQVLSRLGSGGMGEVYLARKISPGREVALKVLSPLAHRDPLALERFIREARAAGSLDHPSIVPVLDSGIVDGRPYLALQLVRGVSAEDLLAGGVPLRARRALEIVRDAARAIEAAHQAGVVHRDVKPGNLLLEGEAGAARISGRVFLTDFGLAHLQDAGTLTRSGEVLGTPCYMPPEQAQGRTTGKAADIYSLGATLYALLSGRAPHEGSNHAEVLARVAREDPTPLRRVNAAIDRDAATICAKAMRRDPGHRYASAAEMAEDIERRLSDLPIRARPPSIVYRSRLFLRRHRTLAAAALAALAISTTLFLSWRALQREDELSAARRALARGEFQSAQEALDRVPGLPWLWWDGERSDLAAGTRLGVGDLSGAVQEKQRFPPWSRDAASLRIGKQVARELRSFEPRSEFLAGNEMWWSLFRVVRSALGGVEGIERVLERDPAAIQEARSFVPRLIELALEGLLRTGQDRAAIEFFECTRPGSFRMDRAREILTRALGLEVEKRPARPLTRTADDILSGRTRPGMSNAENLRILFALLPGLPPSEGLYIEHHLRLRAGMVVAGESRRLKSRSINALVTSGDLDGDGRPEAAVATQHSVELFRIDGEGLQPLLESRVVAEESSKIDSMQLEDLDGVPGDELILYVTAEAAAPASWSGSVRIYGFREGRLELRKEVGGWDGRVSPVPQGLAIGDLDGDARAELVVAFGSGGSEERRVRVIRDPLGEWSSIDLPDGDLPSDVTSVSIADVDGDGRNELMGVTGPWRGRDIRIWKPDAAAPGGFRGPLIYGPLGSFHVAAALDVDGDGMSELFAAKTSRNSMSPGDFEDPPHRGLREGVFLWRLPPGQIIRAGRISWPTADPGSRFPWFHAFDEEVQEPREYFDARSISAGRGLDGRAAAVDSWSMRQGGRVLQFVDFHQQGTTPEFFTSHRLFETEVLTLEEEAWPRGIQLVELVALPPQNGRAETPAILRLEKGMEESGPWTLHLHRLDPPAKVFLRDPIPELMAIHRTLFQLDEAEALARRWFREKGEAAASDDRARVAEEWFQSAAGRLDWASAGEALEILRGAPGVGGEGIEMYRRMVETGRALCGREPAAGISKHSLELPDHPRDGWEPGVRQGRDKTVSLRIEETVHVRMTCEVEVKELEFDHGFYIGVIDPEMQEIDPRVAFFGVLIVENGGGDSPMREVHLHWGRIRVALGDRQRSLGKDQLYRLTLETSPDGQVRLAMSERRLAGGKAGRSFYMAGKLEEKDLLRRPSSAGKPHHFGVLDRCAMFRPTTDAKGGLPAVVTNLEIRLLPAGD